VVEGGEQVAAHLEDEDREGQRRREDGHAGEAAGLAGLPVVVVRPLTGARARFVADGADGAGKVGRRRAAAEDLDGRAFVGEICRCAYDAGDGFERPLHPRDAGGAGHLVHVEGDVFDIRRVARLRERVPERPGRGIRGNRRRVRGEVDGRAVGTFGAAQRIFRAPRAAGAGHPGDAEGIGLVGHGWSSPADR
jgi:hypothetical protein